MAARKARWLLAAPANFDMDQALDRALDVFWRKGYEGATICDLTAAMGINPPSLYAAFGNKEGLFCKALERYADKNEAFLQEALSQPKARDGIAALLRGAGRFADGQMQSVRLPARARRSRRGRACRVYQAGAQRPSRRERK